MFEYNEETRTFWFSPASLESRWVNGVRGVDPNSRDFSWAGVEVAWRAPWRQGEGSSGYSRLLAVMCGYLQLRVATYEL